MKYILGGGLIGLIARDILGPSYKLIPMGRSLYYSWNPPLADNHIIKGEDIDEYIAQYATIPLYIKHAFTLGGHLTNDMTLLPDWLNKMHDNKPQPHCEIYYKSHLEYWAMGDCHKIYKSLQSKYKNEIADGISNGNAKAIDWRNHIIKTDKQSFQYDNLLSTIPLDALIAMAGINVHLSACDTWYYHVETPYLGFEGNYGVLVVDKSLPDIFKAIKISDNNYIFMANRQLKLPGAFFHLFIKDFRLIAETSVPRSIPCGLIQEITEFTDGGIKTIGSTASWDSCQDVGTCIKRLLKMRNG